MNSGHPEQGLTEKHVLEHELPEERLAELGHPEVCPPLPELAGRLGLGLSPKTMDLLFETDEPLESILGWVEGCPTCAAQLETLERWQDEVGYPDFAVVANERPKAEEQWRVLAKVETGAFDRHVGTEHCSWAMSQLLQRQSLDAVRVSPPRALVLAQAAVDLALLLDPGFYTPRLLADLKARAWAHLGNARRVVGNLRAADAAFEQAFQWLQKGSGALISRATLLDLLGSLRKDQRRLDEAARCLVAAAETYEATGQTRLVAKVHLTLGLVDEARGDLEGAVAHLTNAQRLIDPAEDEALYALCQHHLVFFLAEAGYLDEAEIRIPLVRQRYRVLGDHVRLLQLLWVEAKVLRGQARFDAAEAAFLEVVSGLHTSGNVGQMAFAQLDLACLYAELGRSEDVRRLAAEAYLRFSDCGAPQQALAAMAHLCAVVETEVATLGLVQSVARFVTASHRDPDLRFRPARGDNAARA